MEKLVRRSPVPGTTTKHPKSFETSMCTTGQKREAVEHQDQRVKKTVSATTACTQITEESLAIETTCVAYNKSSGQNSSLTTSFFFCSLLTQSFAQSFGKREENVCFLRQF
jgi:hypothetical protein